MLLCKTAPLLDWEEEEEAGRTTAEPTATPAAVVAIWANMPGCCGWAIMGAGGCGWAGTGCVGGAAAALAGAGARAGGLGVLLIGAAGDLLWRGIFCADRIQ